MNKKTLLSASSLLITLTISGSALAAPVAPVTYNSQASVEFTANTDKTDPVDPTNPDQPSTPNGPDDKPGNNTNGPLSIDFASSFNFGQNKVTTADQTYFATAQSIKDSAGNVTDVPNYVQVSDNTGSDQGWALRVNQQTQLTDSNSNELTGAAITLDNSNVATVSGSLATPPTATTQFTLTPGADSVVTRANANEGQGLWVTRFGTDGVDGAKSISLFVPGNSIKRADKYTSTLVWTLSQTPA